MQTRTTTAGWAVALAIASMFFVSGAAMAGQVGAGRGTTPRTPWGDPDLQGLWEYWTFTPLQRPESLADKEVLTDEEAATVAQEGVEAARARDEGPSQGDPGTYGQDVWTERTRAIALNQPSLIVEPRDGRIPAVTAAERQRAAAHRAGGGRPVRLRAGGIGADGPEDRGLSERCIVGFPTGPPLLPSGYNNNVQVFQAPGYVVLLVEMIHDVRVVPIDGRPHLPNQVRQWLGDSRGHWDGETLVIETTNFTDKVGSFSTTGATWGTGEQARLIERFTRVDEDTVEYEFIVEAPTVFTQPFTARYPMSRSELPLFEYACHEGNYGMTNTLRGARAEDQAAEEGK